jgi:hydrogenase nickel incorporation protein HypA/HybF
MHEMSIARSIADIVEGEVARNGIEKLVAVNIAVGRLAAVVPDQLAFCFSMMTSGTGLAGAALNIREVPLGYSCLSCGETFTSEAMSFACPGCGEERVTLTSGSELTVESIEVAD